MKALAAAVSSASLDAGPEVISTHSPGADPRIEARVGDEIGTGRALHDLDAIQQAFAFVQQAALQGGGTEHPVVGTSPTPPVFTRTTFGRLALVGAAGAVVGAGVVVTTFSTTCGVPATITVSFTTTGGCVAAGAAGAVGAGAAQPATITNASSAYTSIAFRIFFSS